MLYEFLIAEVALQRGQPVVAAQAYAELARRTRDPRIAQRATEVALFARQGNAAADAAKVWHETDAESDEALRTLSSILVNTGRLDEAQPYLEKVLAKNSGPSNDSGEAFLQLSQVFATTQDKQAVLRLVRRLAEPYRNVAAARVAVAQAASTAGEDALALEEARAASRLRSDWPLAALLQAGLLQKQSNAAALDYLRVHLEQHPKARDVRLTYARMLIADKQVDEARKQLSQLTQDFPDNADVHYAIGLLSLQLEDYALAESSFRRLLELGFRDRALVQLYLGQIAEDQKRYAEALDWYRQVGRGEHAMTALIRQANVIAKQGDVAAARALLHDTSASSAQQRVQLILAEAQLLREANQSREAFELVEKSLETMPNQPDLLYDYAMLAERLDRVELMESSLRRVIGLKADHAHAYNALGYSLADRNIRLDEAKELIERAMKLAPDDFFIVDSLGWVLYRQGRNEEALRHLQRAFDARQDGEIAAHLGEVLWVLGRREDAERIWGGRP